MRWYLAKRPEEVSRVYGLLAAAAEGCSGHGPAHLLVESADEIGFSWCSELGLLLLGCSLLLLVSVETG